MESVKLLDICSVYQPKTISRKEFSQDGEYLVYGANGIIGRYSKYNHSEEEVLMGCRGACGAIHLSTPYSWINGNAMVIHPIGNLPLSKKYLYYYLMVADKDKIVTGTAQQQITRHNLKNFTIPICTLPEQERIVAKIEELFSQLDDGITNLAKTKKLLRIHKQAVLDKCFSGYAEKHKLKELCAFITKGTTPPKDTFIKTDGIPFIKVYNLTFTTELDFTIEPTFITTSTHNNDLGRSIVYPGDVLMNIVGPPLGKVSIVPNEYKEWNINQAIARFRCLEGLDNKYLAYYLLSHRTIEALKKKSKATAGQVNLTLEICRELEIPLVPLNEQRKMVCDIETKLSNIIQIEKTVDATLIQAEALRQSILKKAFNGEMTH